jgi:hypothetical protein
VRSAVDQRTWDFLRRGCYSKANYRCQICGGRGTKWPVECHEIWQYHDHTRVQQLLGLIALCPKCHEVKHIGRAQASGHGERALKHLMKVNGWSRKEANEYIQKSYLVWNERSRFDWILDISWLEEKLSPRQMRRARGTTTS